MTESDVAPLSLTEAAEKIRRRELTSRELTASFYERAERFGPVLNCFAALLDDRAFAEADRRDVELAAGRRRGALHGVPVTVKDNIATKDVPTTVGSALYEGWIPAGDANAVRRLREAGAVVVAKTNLYELAFGAPSPLFGPTRNPWALDRSTGGSSSGSVAEIAAGLSYGSIGSDTGGSVRVPAAFCGVVGLKPTYDRVSRVGLVPLAPDLDHVGPIARRVRDVAVLFRVLAGAEEVDVTPSGSLQGLTLGVVAEQGSARIDPEVRAAVGQAAECLADLGAQLVEVELPELMLFRTLLWVIASAEAAEYFRERRVEAGDGLHPVVDRRLRRGESILATDYLRAQRARRKLVDDLATAAADVDALLLPVAPIPAYPLGARRVDCAGVDEDVSEAVTRYTPPFSLAGWPAMSVPCGFTDTGLPLGFQLVARPGMEETLFRIGSAYEEATAWHRMRPRMAEVVAGGMR